MQLTVDGASHRFIPIKAFRAQFGLPDDFSINLFQPKEWTGLGSIDRAGAALNTVRDNMVEAVPVAVAAADWPNCIANLANQFERELRAINPTVGLRDEEIDFAVNGFEDVCHAMSFAILRAKLTQTPLPSFAHVYYEWLDGTVSTGGSVYEYRHREVVWSIRLILHAYGRVGMAVQTPAAGYYVTDKRLACPAEGYMTGLLEAIAEKMMDATI
ncbi:MAG: hypothetical protein AAF653_13165 [Chloroflexota bacterium]